jgi:type II secretory pathway pseudopilin PulG
MKQERGISLIELILVVVAVGILALLVSSLPSSIQSIRHSGNTSLAREIASKQLDYFKKQPYANLSNGTSTFSDTGLSKLPSPTAEYEIDDCPVDICTSGEEAKKIKVIITWQEQGDTKNIELSTLIAEGGLGQ